MSGRQYATQRDSYRRKVEKEKLDGYGWVMSLDTVRTPEEILLVKDRFARLERHIDKLSPRIGRVLRLRLGINCRPHTFEEIAEQYGVTRERIRQMEAKGVRIIKRWVWIEERPEDYRRQCENQAKVYKERMEAERAIKEEANRVASELADWDPPREGRPRREQPPDPVGGFVPPIPRTILDEIVKEKKRALELQRQYNSWAAEREAWLRSPMPSWVAGDPIAAYPYKMHKVPIKRDWLNVATEGFSDGT